MWNVTYYGFHLLGQGYTGEMLKFSKTDQRNAFDIRASLGNGCVWSGVNSSEILSYPSKFAVCPVQHNGLDIKSCFTSACGFGNYLTMCWSLCVSCSVCSVSDYTKPRRAEAKQFKRPFFPLKKFFFGEMIFVVQSGEITSSLIFFSLNREGGLQKATCTAILKMPPLFD